MAKIRGIIDSVEEGILALLLTAMVVVSFSQVVARYVFNSGWDVALELTTLLFAWLILFGMSYGVRISAHLGVDAFTRMLPNSWYRFFCIVAALLCILWAAILFDTGWITHLLGQQDRGGALVYIKKMYRIGIELEDLPLQRWLAYIILPIGLLLFTYRCIEAVVDIIRGNRNAIIASHEAEDMVKEVHESKATGGQVD